MTTESSKGGRRGRPPLSREQARDNRRAIIEAARALFAEGGYHGVSMRKIAARAECSPAALYKLFPGKRQLLLHIWEEVFAALIAALEACYQREPAAGRLQALCLTFIDFWLARPDDYRAIFLIEDQPRAGEEAYFVDSSPALTGLAVFRRAILDARSLGEVRGDVDEIEGVLLCGMQGVAMNLITIPEYPWGDPDRLKRAMVTALIAGLR